MQVKHANNFDQVARHLTRIASSVSGIQGTEYTECFEVRLTFMKSILGLREFKKSTCENT